MCAEGAGAAPRYPMAAVTACRYQLQCWQRSHTTAPSMQCRAQRACLLLTVPKARSSSGLKPPCGSWLNICGG